MVALAIPRIDPLMGLMTGLKAFVAAVLGGIGNIPGAMIGGVLIGLLETWLSATAYSTYRDAAVVRLVSNTGVDRVIVPLAARSAKSSRDATSVESFAR
jgi:branched-subunit amino acid ABC-type transport system permease component